MRLGSLRAAFTEFKMAEVKMSLEQAEKEFEKWAEIHGLSFDEKIKDKVEKPKKRVMDAFMNGSLILKDTGKLNYTVSKFSPQGYAGDDVEISGMTGKAWMAMDSYKDDQQIHQLIAVASAVTGKDVGWFANLANTDFLFFTNLIALFTIA